MWGRVENSSLIFIKKGLTKAKIHAIVWANKKGVIKVAQWIHVAGIMRSRELRVLFPDPDFDELFGKEFDYDDEFALEDAKKHPEKYLPNDGDGSLHMSIWKNPDINEIDSYAVSIFGDLKNFEGTPHDIINWFQGKCNQFAYQAVITVQLNAEEPIVWTM